MKGWTTISISNKTREILDEIKVKVENKTGIEDISYDKFLRMVLKIAKDKILEMNSDDFS